MDDDTDPNLSTPDPAEEIVRWLASLPGDRRLQLIGPSRHRSDAFTVLDLGRWVPMDLWIIGRLPLGAAALAIFNDLAPLIARRSHPHLFSIFDGGVHEGRPYLLVQELDGQSLSERIRAQPLPVAEAVELTITLANTLHFVHEAGIVQLDLIPVAIFLSDDHRCMIDLRRTIERRVLSEEGGWIHGGITGCEAPEMLRGRDVAIGREVDVYALGAILYQTLTGHAALIQGAGGLDAIRNILESNPEPIRTFNRQVDRYLESICLRCLAKDPNQRFDSTRSLADELERWQSGELTRRV